MNARCHLTDIVLARHLDGDLEAQAASWMSAEALAEHARDCAVCMHELQAARRLDAALAESSGRQCASGPALEVRLERLLQRAVTTATASPHPATPSLRPRHWLLVGLCSGLLLGMGFAFGRNTQDRGASAPPPPEARSEPPTGNPSEHDIATTDRSATGAIRSDDGDRMEPGIPAGTLPLRSTVADPRREHRAAPATVAAWSAVLANEGVIGAGQLPFAEPPQPVEAADPTGRCLRASRSLLELGTEAALQAWVGAVTKIADQPLRDAVLAAARGHANLVDHLRHRLTGTASPGLHLLGVQTVAAWLGHPQLDAALRQRIRRERNLHLELAAALRSADRRAGTAKLLLDVFGDLAARGAVADDETTAESLFHGQPRRVAAELLDELQSSGETPRRVRALLALGIVGDATMRHVLLSWMRSPGREEAHAAAFALAMLPCSALEDLAAQAARQPGLWLLRTALLRARVPAADTWLEQLALTAEERALLRSPFSFRQLPIVAACFRERVGAAW
jgi:hypothetical protein